MVTYSKNNLHVRTGRIKTHKSYSSAKNGHPSLKGNLSKKKIKTTKKNNFRFLYILIAAILYGMSWVRFIDINLSFLAWFAFVPLFIDLEKRNSFRSYYIHVSLFSLISYLIIGNGFLFIAADKVSMAIGVLNEIFMSTIPLALFYPFKKRFGFNKAIILLPFITALWEWVYQLFRYTLGFTLVANSQARNTALIQYIDIFGVWSITFWVIIFNVLIYLLYKKHKGNIFSLKFGLGLSAICALMLLPPLVYSSVRHSQIAALPKKQINITLINTDFSLLSNTYDDAVKNVQKLTYLTDSVNYVLKQNNMKSDLYVWHEAAIQYGNDTVFTDFVHTAVNDWKTPLLTGISLVPEFAAKHDLRHVNRAALFVPGQNKTVQYYDKLRLMPGHEIIPYSKLLSKLPFIHISPTDSLYLKPGNKVRVIELKTQSGTKVKIGTPICIEQLYSNIWSDMVLKGAQCFIPISFESWWTRKDLLKEMDSVTRLRCIETRRSAARCSNGGLTCFIDAFGTLYDPAKNESGATRANILLYSDITFFSNHQEFFPALCFFMIILFSIYFVFKQHPVQDSGNKNL